MKSVVLGSAGIPVLSDLHWAAIRAGRRAGGALCEKNIIGAIVSTSRLEVPSLI